MTYLPVLLAILVALGLGAALWVLASILRPRDSSGGIEIGTTPAATGVKSEPFESGIAGTKFRKRFNIKFYVVALLFVIFDVEAVFLYPLAVVYRELGVFAFAEMTIFVGVLSLGLVYVWKKGALEWS